MTQPGPRLGRLFAAVIPAFALLVGLGIWQVERLQWKTALLRAIDAAEAAPPVPLGPGLPPYAKVRIIGHWLAPTALYGAQGRGTTLGAQLIGVLAPEHGPPVVVDRGWVADTTPPPAPQGEAEVVGWMHPPSHPGWFSAEDDVKGRHFYTLDPQRIATALGAGRVAPFVLVALGPPGTPDPARALPRPPNDHLSYAATWFGLAGALAGVTFAFVLKARRA